MINSISLFRSLTGAVLLMHSTEKGIDEEEVNNLASVIDKCEYARFAPSSSAEEAEKIYDEASRFIRLFENSIG